MTVEQAQKIRDYLSASIEQAEDNNETAIDAHRANITRVMVGIVIEANYEALVEEAIKELMQ